MYEITGTPTIISFEGGLEVDRYIGPPDYDTLNKFLTRNDEFQNVHAEDEVEAAEEQRNDENEREDQNESQS